MLQRLARACVRHRWIVIGAWVAILVVLNGIASSIGPDWRTEFTQPDSETKEVQDLLEANNPERAGFSSTIVLKADQTLDDDAVQDRVEELMAIAESYDGVQITSPYDNESQISPDRTIGYIQLDVSNRDFEALTDTGQEMRDDLEELEPIEGLQVEYGGDLFGEFELPESEVYGVLAAVIILIIAFGSVTAMGLPIGIALFGLGCATAIVTVLSNPLTMPDFTSAMVAMIGLGVGIDYALFIVTRYREALRAGLSVPDAVAESLDTSGRAVIFAGTTVIISLLGLTLMGLAFVTGVAIASAIGVLMMVIASLTLLPALLGWVGSRIDNTTRVAVICVGIVVVAVFLAVTLGAAPIMMVGLLAALALFVGSFFIAKGWLRALLPHRHEPPKEKRFWYRWSRVVQHRPWFTMLGSAALLILLALPVFSIRLGFGDYGNLPESQTVRRAYDLLAEGFGPGSNGPIFMTVEGEIVNDPAAMQAFADDVAAGANEVAADDAERVVATFVPPAPSEDLALVIVYPAAAPQDAETANLVSTLRDDVLPVLVEGSDTRVLVGGATAAAADFAAYLGDRMPILIGVVLLLSFLLLMAVFRSILVPLKAVVMNLLSVGAAYGILVAIFQWGWGAELIGVDRSGPIEAWIPMFLFAIVFGLSMDYEVFLLSRIKEEYDKSVRRGRPDNGTAVADGLSLTARVITAAALIMFCVFGAFVLGDDRSLKMFGLGLAIAVLIDATVVRMVLVPSTMELLGDRNWWIPKWLDRILPKIDVEGHHRAEDEPPEPPVTPPAEPVASGVG
jgi:RND superfamily putative drug exporter